MESNPAPLRPVFTIGYERATLAQVTTALSIAGVDLLIDVRAVAASRRAGFSKTILAASLRDVVTSVAGELKPCSAWPRRSAATT